MAAIDPLGGISSLLRTTGSAALGGAGSVTGAAGAAAPGATGGISSVGGVNGTAGITGITGISVGTEPSAAGGSFLDSLGDALGNLNSQLNSADAAMASFATGGSADLHTVMLELQQASIGLKTGIAVRDKVLEAYQELMRLQI